MLLARPGDPRSVWLKYAPDTRSGQIDADAITEVLRGYGSALPDLRRVVDDVLVGRQLTAPVLATFVAAFDLSPRHATRLQDLLGGSDSVRVISSESLAELYRDTGPPRHDTIALHELHTLGPDGLPAEHQTIQVD